MQKVLECIEGNAGNPDFNVKGLAGLFEHESGYVVSETEAVYGLVCSGTDP